MKLESWTGRLLGRASSERGGGKPVGSSGWVSSKTSSARARSRRRRGPERPQARALGKAVGDELIGGPRDERLAAVGERAQARAAVQRRADVVSGVAQQRLAAMQGDPHPKLCAIRPLGGGQAALKLERTGKRSRGLGEGDHGAVALALLERASAAGGDDRALEELVVKRRAPPASRRGRPPRVARSPRRR